MCSGQMACSPASIDTPPPQCTPGLTPCSTPDPTLLQPVGAMPQEHQGRAAEGKPRTSLLGLKGPTQEGGPLNPAPRPSLLPRPHYTVETKARTLIPKLWHIRRPRALGTNSWARTQGLSPWDPGCPAHSEDGPAPVSGSPRAARGPGKGSPHGKQFPTARHLGASI